MGRDWYAEKYKDQPEKIAERNARMEIHRSRSVEARKAKKDLLLQAMLQADAPLARLVNDLAEKYHLTESQQRYFLVRLRYKNDKDTADAIGLSRMTVGMWDANPKVIYGSKLETRLTPVPQFRAARDEYKARIGELAGEIMEGLAIKVVDRTDELLDATKKTYNEKGDLIREEPDYGARARGIETVSRWIGKGWNDHQDHSTDPAYVQIMARFNEEVVRLAESKRLLQPTVEGEFKVVNDGTG